MPYGIRKAILDNQADDSPVEIDFDLAWKNILKPAIPEYFYPKRADELNHSGLIDRHYIEWLYDAEIVLADLTFGNPNVYYELGIRHALAKRGTVAVACEGTRLPFNVHNQRVVYYPYFRAANLHEFQVELRKTIEEATLQPAESPVYLFLQGLVMYRGTDPDQTISALQERVDQLEKNLLASQSREAQDRIQRKISEATTTAHVVALVDRIKNLEFPSLDTLESFAIKLRKFGCLDLSLEVLQRALSLDSSDPDILREIGFVFRKKGEDFYGEAEKYLRGAIEINNGDAEAHGMLGGLLKRRKEFQEALEHYKAAHALDPENLYPLVNLGAMYGAVLNFDEAHRWYDATHRGCLNTISASKADYWTYLCLAESLVVAGDPTNAIIHFQQAKSLGAPPEDFRSATEQLEFLAGIGLAAPHAEQTLAALGQLEAAS